MKTLFTLGLVLLLDLGIYAQNNSPELYLLFEFMQVKGEQKSEFLKAEDFWSGIHKQRVADRSILGWNLWSLIPSGNEQGSQYLTVTLFPHLQDMLSAVESLEVMAYAKKAYPNKTEKELILLLDKTPKTWELAHQVLLKRIDATKSDFKLEIGTLLTMDIVKQLDDNYEKVQFGIFKPWHQQMVAEGKEGLWLLLRNILPSGAEVYGTHLTISMYKDEAQLASFMENAGGEMDLKTQLAVKQSLRFRGLRETKIAKLIMSAH